MNPRKKHNKVRSARRRAVKKSGKLSTQEWRGSDPGTRDAKKKIQRLFKSVLNGNGNGE